MSNFDRHLTNEQLSSLLDDQFLPGEPIEEYREHLRSCSQCQHILEDLRQTVTLLHSLPQPVLPRSFTLPIDTTTPQPSASHPQASPLPATPAPIISIADRQRRRPRYLRDALRIVALLVAAIGVLLMLSGLLPSLSGTSTNSATSSGSSSVSVPTYGSQSANSSARSDTTPTPPSGRMVSTPRPSIIKPKPTAPPNSQSPPVNNTTNPPSTLLASLNTMDNRIGLGILLFFLGAICFTLFRQR